MLEFMKKPRLSSVKAERNSCWPPLISKAQPLADFARELKSLIPATAVRAVEHRAANVGAYAQVEDVAESDAVHLVQGLADVVIAFVLPEVAVDRYMPGQLQSAGRHSSR